MHRATRLHYDFRLEADGVLASWAVPKGPTLVPLDRRLAMHVEDHPMDYRDFEGNIPAKQYGAGSVIVWDRGTYTLAEGTDPAAEIANGKIKFVLHGKKLKGEFTLVKIKAARGRARRAVAVAQRSRRVRRPEIRSGRSSRIGKERQDAGRRRRRSAGQDVAVQTGRALRGRTTRASAPRNAIRSRIPKSLMLATLVAEPFDDPAWLFEIKWDGYRALCTIDEKDEMYARLAQRPRHAANVFRTWRNSRARLPACRSWSTARSSASMRKGRSDFQRLQESQKKPAGLTYAAFDLLYADGKDLRSTPLEERKALLERLIEDDTLVLYSKHVVGQGKELFEVARKKQLEGIIGKRRDSTYQERRSRDWVKIKTSSSKSSSSAAGPNPRAAAKASARCCSAFTKKKGCVTSARSERDLR